jgi:hypothetical protein
MTDEKSPDEEIEQALQKSVEKVEQLALTIRDTSVGNEDVWYRNLLLGILNSALLDFRYLKIGEKQHSPYLAAWSCRNLLELKVIATYVLASADNAKTFKNDFVVDAKEFYEAISKRHRATHPKLIAAWQAGMQEFEGDERRALETGLQREIERGPQTQETDEETEAYRKLMDEFGYYNLRGERTLRAYAGPVNLARLDGAGWMTAEEDVWCVPELLIAARHYPLFPHRVARELPRLDRRSFEAGMHGWVKH